MQRLNRTQPPQIHDAIEFSYNLPPLQQQRLDNGIPLFWLSGGVQEVAEIDFVFPAGVWYEQKPMVAQATAGLLKNGTRHRSAHQVHEALEFFGASLQVSAGDDYCIVSLYALSKDLPRLLPVVWEVLTEAQFTNEELSIYKQNATQRLLLNLRKCEFVANQQIDAMLWGETHPYGRYSRVEKIEGLQREDLLAFYESAYRLGNMKIFMGGKVGEAEVALLNQVFGAAAITTTATSVPDFPTDQKPAQQSIVNDEAGVQSAIRISRHFPNRHHPDFPRMVVLNTLFGGYFGSRLMKNIREDKGYTYGIYSGLQPRMHGGSLIIQAEVGREVTEAAIREVYAEMDILRREPAPEEELLLVKNYLLGGLLGDLDGPFQLLHRWRSLILNGLDEAHFNQNVAIYKGITSEELQALADRYYRPEDFWQVVVV